MPLWPAAWRANLPWAGVSTILGNLPNDGALIDISSTIDAQERSIVKSDCSVLAADEDLFVITGGPIVVTEFVGIVTTEIGAGASTCQIQIDVTEPAGTVNLSTAVDIDADAAGTSYTFTAATPGVLTPTTAGAIDQLPKNYWLCPIGTVKAAFSADRDGVIAWYMVFKPLAPGSVVTPA